MNKESIHILQKDAVNLLMELIATPSFSREENKTADLISLFLKERKIEHSRVQNNVWAKNKHFDKNKPSILLNSHHDTVKPNPQYTKDPFDPLVEDSKLFGLGSNDAGGCLVSLIAAFLFFYEKENLNYNIVLAATAEEEISGTDGIELLLKDAEFISQTHGSFDFPFFAGKSCGIVGEPTLMQLAVSEKGLMVLDAVSHGKAGHAARNEGENAIVKALQDIAWFQTFQFPKVSVMLGPVKMSVTVIETENKAHNVVPAICRFVVDIRINDCYTHEEILDIVRENVLCDVKARSMRMRSSIIAKEHPLVVAGLDMGRSMYGSPTGSDKALIPFSVLKMGPGDSARSHSADEFIYISEIDDGIEKYINLLTAVTS
jgi:acetylornithine deacetylase